MTYHATKRFEWEGRVYHAGDIVQADVPKRLVAMNGLVPFEKSAKDVRIQRSAFFGAPDPVVSVVVTLHNQEKFAGECLDGFWRQDIQEPYEVIAVVDASTDRTAAVVRRNFPHAQVYTTNFGNAAAARNVGLRAARGDYVCFFDGDDVAYPAYLRKLRKALDLNPKAGVAYARFDHVLYGFDKGRIPRCNSLEWSERWIRFSPVTNTPSMLRKDAAMAWDERFRIMQDFQYNLALSASGVKGVHVREELWRYRHHPGSIWNSSGDEKKVWRTEAEEMLRSEYGWREDPASVTFVSLISRDQVLKEYFAQIPKLGIPKDAHWLVMVDSDRDGFVEKVKALVRKYEKPFMSSRVYVTNRPNRVDSRDFEERGMRVARMLELIVNEVGTSIGGTDRLFMVEDDTVAPKRSYPTLLKTFDADPRTAYASGIECGRGSTRHTGVCFLVTDKRGVVVGREIPPMQDSGVLPIGGGGWYCWIGRIAPLQRLIKERGMRADGTKMLGPDVFMVHDLAAMGYLAFADFSVQCRHYDPKAGEWLEARIGKGYHITWEEMRDKRLRMQLDPV